MGDIKNLKNEEALAKLKELAKDNTCFFCTYENDKIISRPMSTQGIDDDGTIWFLSKRDSAKNFQIDGNHKVYLMYMDNGKQRYLSVRGTAEVHYNKKKIDELWTPITKAWFTEGKNDPEITLLKVSPEEGHYWDTKNGKLISLIKIASAVLSGKEMDGGVEGSMSL